MPAHPVTTTVAVRAWQLRKIIIFAAEHPWSVLITLLAITVLATTRIQGLRINVSAESMIVEDDPAPAIYERTRRFFPDQTSLMILLQDPDLFAPDKLRAVRYALDKIEALPFVTSTQSLFSLRNIRSADGEITTRPFLEEFPQSREEADRIRHDALYNPLIRDNLLSEDGKSMAVRVNLNPDPEKAVSDEYTVAAVEAIQGFAAAHIDPGLRVNVTGESILRARAADSIAAGQARSLLLMVFDIWLIISLLFVNMKAGLVAVVPNVFFQWSCSSEAWVIYTFRWTHPRPWLGPLHSVFA